MSEPRFVDYKQGVKVPAEQAIGEAGTILTSNFKALADKADLHDASIVGIQESITAIQEGQISLTWNNISGKPTTFPPTLPISQSDVTGLNTTLDNLLGDISISGSLINFTSGGTIGWDWDSGDMVYSSPSNKHVFNGDITSNYNLNILGGYSYIESAIVGGIKAGNAYIGSSLMVNDGFTAYGESYLFGNKFTIGGTGQGELFTEGTLYISAGNHTEFKGNISFQNDSSTTISSFSKTNGFSGKADGLTSVPASALTGTAPESTIPDLTNRSIILSSGTTSARNAFTPSANELIYDTTERALYVGDGVTPGGLGLNDFANGFTTNSYVTFGGNSYFQTYGQAIFMGNVMFGNGVDPSNIEFRSPVTMAVPASVTGLDISSYFEGGVNGFKYWADENGFSHASFYSEAANFDLSLRGTFTISDGGIVIQSGYPATQKAAISSTGVFTGIGSGLTAIPQSAVTNLSTTLSGKLNVANPTFTGSITSSSQTGPSTYNTAAISASGGIAFTSGNFDLRTAMTGYDFSIMNQDGDTTFFNINKDYMTFQATVPYNTFIGPSGIGFTEGSPSGITTGIRPDGLIGDGHQITGLTETQIPDLTNRTVVLSAGTTSQREAYTPIANELIYDSSLKQLFVGDGTTAGGNSVQFSSIRTTEQVNIESTNSDINISSWYHSVLIGATEQIALNCDGPIEANAYMNVNAGAQFSEGSTTTFYSIVNFDSDTFSENTVMFNVPTYFISGVVFEVGYGRTIVVDTIATGNGTPHMVFRDTEYNEICSIYPATGFTGKAAGITDIPAANLTGVAPQTVIPDLSNRVITLSAGTTTERMTYTPVASEPVFDTTLGQLFIGDGTTVGGNPLQVDSSNFGSTNIYGDFFAYGAQYFCDVGLFFSDVEIDGNLFIANANEIRFYNASNNEIVSTISANGFYGNAVGLTNIPAVQVTGLLPESTIPDLTSRTLIVSSGTTTARTAFTPIASELIYDQNLNQLFIGDGATQGGMAISPNWAEAGLSIYKDWMNRECIEVKTGSSIVVGTGSLGTNQITYQTAARGLEIWGDKISFYANGPVIDMLVMIPPYVAEPAGALFSMPIIAPAANTNAIGNELELGAEFEIWDVTLSSNTNITMPATAYNGQRMVLRVTLSASVTLTWGTNIIFGSSYPSSAFPTTSGSIFEAEFRYHSGTSKWRCVNIAKGF